MKGFLEVEDSDEKGSLAFSIIGDGVSTESMVQSWVEIDDTLDSIGEAAVCSW